MFISDTDKKIITDILAAVIPTTPVYAFGSRVTGGYRATSDLDLLLDDQEVLPTITISALREAFEDSPLHFRVDILLRSDIDHDFFTHIASHLELLEL